MSHPLKVVHVMLSLDVGGLERNVVNQVRQAPNFNQQVTVICLDTPGAMAGDVEALGGRVLCLHRRPGIRPGLIRKLATFFREIQPDVVHTHQIASLLYAGLAARRSGVPVVVHTEHGQERYATRRRTRLLGRIAGRYARRFYCLTADMAGRIASYRIVPDEKIRQIVNGIDVTQFTRRYDTVPIRLAMGIPLDVPLIGTVGRLSEVKRQDLLLRL